MVPLSTRSYKNKEVNRGSWTAEEDQRLAQVIEVHGPRKWKSVATKAAAQELSSSSEPQNVELRGNNAVPIGIEDDSSKCEENYFFKSMSFNGSSGDEFLFDGSSVDEGPLNLEWMNRFLEMDESWFTLHDI
nr:MYB transcription factor protein [Rosa persica]